MGQVFRKLFDAFFGNSEMRVVMLGLDAAGKTTILYKLHIGEVLSTVPTIGFNVEKVQYKNVIFTVWDVGGQEKLRPLWRHYFNDTNGLIYVVDSLDRERIGKAKQEFQAIINDPFMTNCVILVFANKQDMVAKQSMQTGVVRYTCYTCYCIFICHKTLMLDQIESNICRCPDLEYAGKMIVAIDVVRVRGDYAGGVVTCIVRNLPDF